VRSEDLRRSFPGRRAAGAACVLLLAQSCALAAGDPLAGTWELQPRLSHYASGAVPKRMTVVIEALEGAIHYRSSSETAAGVQSSAEYTAAFDGVPVLVTGHTGLLAPVALRRLDARTVEATYARPFLLLATSRWSASRDGRRLTIATRTTGTATPARTNVSVYRRVP